MFSHQSTSARIVDPLNSHFEANIRGCGGVVAASLEGIGPVKAENFTYIGVQRINSPLKGNT